MDDLVSAMTPVLWHVVRAYGHDRQSAEDVVATTWLGFVRLHHTIQDPRAVAAWSMSAFLARGSRKLIVSAAVSLRLATVPIPHLQMDRRPAVAGDPSVRVTTPDDLEVLYPACVAMYTEEVGVSPESDAGGGDLYRARIQQLIGRGWSMASFDEQGVVFKAEVACVTPYAAQVQGVWVRPDQRGKGLATSGMAAVVSHVLDSGMAPVVSLYVNEWNLPARATYARVGFEQTATFATLMF